MTDLRGSPDVSARSRAFFNGYGTHIFFFLSVDHQSSKVEEIKEETIEEHREEMMQCRSKQYYQHAACSQRSWRPLHTGDLRICNFTHM